MTDSNILRQWWWHRQGLDGSMSGCSPAEILRHVGWARSVAGVGPYLTMFSRGPWRRSEIDAEVEALRIHELPSTRGCTYVVPESDFALALTLSQSSGDGDWSTAQKLGVTEQEIDRLCDGILAALVHEPLDPSELRDATGDLSRSLGDAGKKKGLTTTLPIALSRLQDQGAIRRIAIDRRLDSQRYRYALWKPNPLAKSNLTADDAYVQLAEKYFHWIGPATVSEFRWFSGLGSKAANRVISELDLIPIESESDRLLPADLVGDYKKFKPSRRAQFALVSSMDSIALLRRDLKPLIAAEDLELTTALEQGKQTLSGLSDWPSHAILDRGRWIGMWEYDIETESIVADVWVPRNKTLDAVIEATEDFIRTDLQDARSFSLDSPKSRIPRLEAIRTIKRY